MMQKQRNASIDIFRYVAAILVVALHVTAFADIHPMISYFFAQILPRISVPFFFAVSGYYFTSKLEQNKGRPWKYALKLLTTYALWSIPYSIVSLLSDDTLNIGHLLYSFFITGSAYHFWFFPAIIVSSMLVAAAFRIRCQKALIPISLLLYVITCLGTGYYKIGCQIPFISSLYTDCVLADFYHLICPGLCFFVLGYLIFKTQSLFLRLRNRTGIVLFCVSFLFFLAEIGFLKVFDLASNISTTVGLYFVVYFLIALLIKNPMPQWQKASAKCRNLANVTYYSHVLIITLVSSITNIFGHSSLPETIMFGIVVSVTGVLGLLLSKINHPIAKLFLS